jgi:oligopeptide transport system substrate-binding protein
MRRIFVLTWLVLGCSVCPGTEPGFTLPCGEPKDLDPQREVGINEFRVLRALFEGLVGRNARTGEPVPAAATAWKMTDGGRKWVFTLRPDARWSDGSALTADDFVYSWRRLLDPQTAADYANLGWVLKNGRAFNRGEIRDASQLGVCALGPQILQVELERPIPYFLGLLDTPALFPVPRGAIEKYGKDWTRPGNQISNGPFVLKEWQAGHRIRLLPNPRYWDHAHVSLPQIVFLLTNSAATDENLFRAGEVQLVLQVPPEKLDWWRAQTPSVFRSEAKAATTYLVVNTRQPPLNDPRVRRALALAIDRQRIVKYVTRGDESPLGTFSPAVAGYRPTPRIPLDGSGLAEARRLLEQAGYPGGRGLPPIELRVAAAANNRKVFEAIQEMWRVGLGVSIPIAAEEAKVLYADVAAGNFSLASASWGADYLDPKTFLDLWESASAFNPTGFADPEYDRLIEQASAEMDLPRRYRTFGKAEDRLLDAMPVIPLYAPQRQFLLSPRVHGWFANDQDVHPWKEISVDP